MKKEMFNVWYNKYGKELAKTALPIDDVDEKEIRRKAKEIFSYTYDIFSEFMCDRLAPLYDNIICQNDVIDEMYKEICMKKKDAETIRDEITPHMTKLYDSYYKEKSIDKEQFNSLKKYFGEILSDVKEKINACDTTLSILKREKKYVKSLLITE